jgi:hypothetical protein
MTIAIPVPIIQAAALRYRRGERMEDLAGEYGRSIEGLRTAMRRHYPGLGRISKHAMDRKEHAGSPHCGQVRGNARPPPEVIAEAMRAYAVPRDVTAMVCGDPLPGRSAWDRR